MKLHLPSLGLVCLIAWIGNAVSSTAQHGRQAIIIDTDIMSDVDDVGALAVANALHNCGLDDLRGVVINTRSRYGALAASVVNTYFGNGDIPIAAMRPLTDEAFLDTYAHLRGEYASKLAYDWPRRLNDSAETPTPVELYRSVLASADKHSINIISIGFSTNLADLLSSGSDDISPLTGCDLVQAKVGELIIMGGQYPSGWEYNFGGVDPESVDFVLRHWPRNVPVTFSGVELGGDIWSGQTLRKNAPYDSPVRAAYEWYMGRCDTVQKSWDPVTVLYGVLGLRGFTRIGMQAPLHFANEDGYNSVDATDGSNAWINDSQSHGQHWLSLTNGTTNETVAGLLNQLYTQDPAAKHCAGLSEVFRSQVAVDD
ncbi:hypothetical protein LTR53_009051 [Teratosphaeriaceae sp. CCFEE 6253]|nr:hypothetical protein LTR53_009051 [Teratosphaeriaceae sp. CCFEE 6253]